MDFPRYTLLGGIAVILYLLLIQWRDFTPTQFEPPQQDEFDVIQTQETQQLPIPQVKQFPSDSSIPTDSVTNTPVNNDDVPVLLTAKNSVEEIVKPNTSPTIDVLTDTLKLQISLEGGDIVKLQLPQHYASLETPDIPFTLLQRDTITYIAQSGLVGPNGTDSKLGRANFSSEKTLYSLQDNEDQLNVDLLLTQENGVKIIKRYSFNRNDYLINIEYIIDNLSHSPWQATLYGQIKRDNNPDPASNSGGGMGVQPFLGMATSTQEDRFLKLNFEDMAEEPFKSTTHGSWIAIIQHYFLSAWIPDQKQTHNYSSAVTRQGLNIVRFTSPPSIVNPGQRGIIKAQYYAGPKDQYRLKEISEGLDLSVDYGWLWMIAQPLYWVMTKFYNLSGNWGIAIILLTVLVKAIFFWPSAMAYKSMAKMRQIQPKMLELKERFPEDKQAQSQGMMELYKKEGVNPLGGCLPIVIQMPVFIALYWVLLESVELRHAPFFGYIKDLSTMDPYFIMPLVMGLSMFIQQRLNPAPPDPMQAKVMQWMPVMFTFFFLWFPAGLVLYWVVNNILSIIQQYVISKQVEAASSKS